MTAPKSSEGIGHLAQFGGPRAGGVHSAVVFAPVRQEGSVSTMTELQLVSYPHLHTFRMQDWYKTDWHLRRHNQRLLVAITSIRRLWSWMSLVEWICDRRMHIRVWKVLLSVALGYSEKLNECNHAENMGATTSEPISDLTIVGILTYHLAGKTEIRRCVDRDAADDSTGSTFLPSTPSPTTSHATAYLSFSYHGNHHLEHPHPSSHDHSPSSGGNKRRLTPIALVAVPQLTSLQS